MEAGEGSLGQSDSECSVEQDDNGTQYKLPRRGECLMCAFWGKGTEKCQEHG